MPAEHALAELARCAGTQFDPAVVDAFAIVIARPRVDELDVAPRSDLPAPA
jgi:response regulator RpfG family c-di-GMP phosphodiesterase